MIIYLSNVLFFYIYVSLREGISPSFLLQNRPINSFFSTGGGATQIFMISVLFKPMVDAGLTEDTAWRASMAFPAMMMISCAICVKCLCWDMPTGKHYDPHVTGKKQNPSVWDYWEVLKDFRVVVMIFQYSACFGCELAMNNQLATHFRTGLPQPEMIDLNFSRRSGSCGCTEDFRIREFEDPTI